MNKPVGLVCKRIDFDNFLMEEMKVRKNIQLIEGVSLDMYQLENKHSRLSSKPEHHYACICAYSKDLTGYHQ